MAEIIQSSISEESAEAANTAKAIKVTLPLKWRSKTTVSYSPYGDLGWVSAGANEGMSGRDVTGLTAGYVTLFGSGPDDGYVKEPGNPVIGPVADSKNVTSTTFGSWGEGGTAQILYKLCLYSTAFAYQWGAAKDTYYVQFYGLINWYSYQSEGSYELTQQSIEIDFAEVFNRLRLQYSPHLYYIVAARLAAVGEGEDDTEVTVDLDTLNNIYGDDGSYIIPEDQKTDPYQDPFGTLVTPTTTDQILDDGETIISPMDIANTDFKPLGGDYAEGEFNTAAQSLAMGSCIQDAKTVSTTMIFWLLERPMAGSAAGSGFSLSSDATSPDAASYSGGGSMSGGTGSQSAKSGNTVLPFNSVTVTGDNYNNFVDAGGGIITEDGDIYPTSDAMYADRISISVEGSSATVIEPVEFDEEPTLDMYKKVYIYLLDENNVDKPVMTGYIISRSRTLSDKGQQIEYEVRDLSFFLNQFQTPSYYVYRPPSLDGSGVSKTYSAVLKEVLNLVGFSNAQLSLPLVAAPAVNWVYRPLTEVVEWATKLFGKYVYYINRSGILTIKATDDGDFIKNYRIPTKGEAVGTHKVLGFKPITDFTRSRARIILTGDFELTEYKTTQVLQNITAQTLFFRPGKTLITHLISKPSEGPSARIIERYYAYTIEGRTYWAPSYVDKEISIDQISTQPGDSFLYIEDVAVPFAGKTEWFFQYACQSDAPIQVLYDTGLTGGTEVINRPEFKKISCPGMNVNDMALMQKYLLLLKEFYKPMYGGELTLDGLDTDLVLLGKVSITNTALPATEASNLIVYEINYDVPNKKTTISLSNKVYNDLPFFDPVRERSRDKNEMLVKMGQLEAEDLYKKY